MVTNSQLCNEGLVSTEVDGKQDLLLLEAFFCEISERNHTKYMNLHNPGNAHICFE
jgi:hypothetical protein